MDNIKETKVKPFIKWAGGKAKLLPQLTKLFPDKMPPIYIEPFIGGGAMLFHVLSTKPEIEYAIINDMNSKLISTYRSIKESPDNLCEILLELQKKYSSYSLAKQKEMFESIKKRI